MVVIILVVVVVVVIVAVVVAVVVEVVVVLSSSRSCCCCSSRSRINISGGNDCRSSLFNLILYVPSTIFQLNRDWSSWVEPVLSDDKCVLLMDSNAVTPVRLEPVAPR